MTLFENELETIPPAHYYGDTVRNIFLISSILLILLPLFDKELYPLYLFPGVFILLGLVVLAGLTSPTKHFSIIADTLFAGALFVFFEYLALVGGDANFMHTMNITFMLRQLLAILFLLALYFGVKTWRGAASQPPFPLS